MSSTPENPFSDLLTLGSLADPRAHTDPLTIDGEEPTRLLAQLRMMWVIRKAEERIADWVAEGQVRCPCHLGIGQEAVAVGVSANLRSSDAVFGGHRSHSHFLAQGGELGGLMAEIQGKASGCSKGMGGSMHLYDGPRGFLGSVPIVAATVPLAVGAALAKLKDGRGDVGVTYFGDGAAEEGCVHESLNFAAIFRVPVLFVCENNFFSSHLHIKLRQPGTSVARYAAVHGIPYEVVDGNDVVAVRKAAARLIERSRSGGGPGFLEAVTYRWRGHVGPSEDIDVGVQRKEDLGMWKRRDPIRRLADSLIAQGHLTETAYGALREEVQREVEAAAVAAEAAPYPPLSQLLDHVYAGRKS